MRRRIILAGGLAASLVVTKGSTAQQPKAKIPRVGILTAEESERAPKFDAFRAGLRDLGYIEGRKSSSNSASPEAIFRGGRN